MPPKQRGAQDRNKRGAGLEGLVADNLNMTENKMTGKRTRVDDSAAEEIR